MFRPHYGHPLVNQKCIEIKILLNGWPEDWSYMLETCCHIIM